MSIISLTSLPEHCTYHEIRSVFVPGGEALRIVMANDILIAVHHVERVPESILPKTWINDPKPGEAVAKWIERYAEGAVDPWPCDVGVVGTEFQKKVWQEIADIAYGGSISYTMLAERAGRPRAVRAAASACGANPVPLLIPCHRVIGKGGHLGGFGWGLDYKRALLALEQDAQSLAA